MLMYFTYTTQSNNGLKFILVDHRMAVIKETSLARRKNVGGAA
jgi:hypothetical protein